MAVFALSLLLVQSALTPFGRVDVAGGVAIEGVKNLSPCCRRRL